MGNRSIFRFPGPNKQTVAVVRRGREVDMVSKQSLLSGINNSISLHCVETDANKSRISFGGWRIQVRDESESTVVRWKERAHPAVLDSHSPSRLVWLSYLSFDKERCILVQSIGDDQTKFLQPWQIFPRKKGVTSRSPLPLVWKFLLNKALWNISVLISAGSRSIGDRELSFEYNSRHSLDCLRKMARVCSILILELPLVGVEHLLSHCQCGEEHVLALMLSIL